MNKTLKKVVFGIGAVILLIVLLFGGLMLKVKSETKGMTPIETKKIVDNIYAIQDEYVNVFVVQDGDKYIVIDAGNTAEDVSKGLRLLNINSEKVVAVLLTHTDRDHVGSLELFKNAKIYFSRQEEV